MKFLPVFGLALLSAASANAGPRSPDLSLQSGIEAAILVSQNGGLQSFEADGNDGIWLQDLRGRWYYGKFSSNCPGVKFTNKIGYEVGSTAVFDKFSAIIVTNQRCDLQSLVTSENPHAIKARKQFLEYGTSDYVPESRTIEMAVPYDQQARLLPTP
jgi:hypothetical protein